MGETHHVSRLHRLVKFNFYFRGSLLREVDVESGVLSKSKCACINFPGPPATYNLHTLQMHNASGNNDCHAAPFQVNLPLFIFHYFNFILIQRRAFRANYSAEFLREREREGER